MHEFGPHFGHYSNFCNKITYFATEWVRGGGALARGAVFRYNGQKDEEADGVREIYCVEDDGDIARSVAAYLGARGFQVTALSSAAGARAALEARRPELLLLDWNLPDGDGELLCRWVRERFGDRLPVLFLTVKGAAADVVRALGAGADDHLSKPFDLSVLHARVLALLRRAGGEAALRCGPLRLDRARREAWCGEERLELSPVEYRLLQLLMENAGRTLTRARLLEEIWDAEGNFVNDNTLTVAVKRLREKLDDPGRVRTVRSFGYRLEDEP